MTEYTTYGAIFIDVSFNKKEKGAGKLPSQFYLGKESMAVNL